VIRPGLHPGRFGRGLSFNKEGVRGAVRYGLDASPVTEVLIEESVIGWKEFELEVMRDLKDNVVIICSIENLDPWACIPATASPWPRPRP
jgi:carbamoyl-phosphate synthase large subunit